ncbi:MAG: MlaD family protein [Deltaproteobacteria bacterium]|nr:MlaD family protein [Deltaproteobacteria bacterium]
MTLMNLKLKPEIKVGIFAAAAIAIVIFATVRVGDQSVVSGGGYDLFAVFSNVAGLYPKASVEVAGVDVGVVKEIGLKEGKAEVKMAIKKKIKLPENSVAFLKTRGFLGEAYVEIIPGDPSLPVLKDGDFFLRTDSGGDVTSMVNQFNAVAGDVKDITGTIKEWVDEEQGGAVADTVNNFNDFVRVLREVSLRNEQNLDRIMQNMADLTHELKGMVANSRGNIEISSDRIASISQKIDEGRGTIGKLVNDPETVNKLNESLDNLTEALGGYKQMELGLGFHTEYLRATGDFKNYFDASFGITPDEALLVSLVSDTEPPLKRENRTTDITVGGVTTSVQTETIALQRNKLLFSAQMAKKFYNFTIRGGLIESTGGLGLDFSQGPLGVQFSAFDFQTKFNSKPHLKAMGTLALTDNLYVTGGADDFINPRQPVDFFFGGGFRLVDDQIKSLLGLSSLKR